MDVISGTITTTQGVDGQMLEYGFYTMTTAAATGAVAFHVLGLKGQEPGVIIDSADTYIDAENNVKNSADETGYNSFTSAQMEYMKTGINLNNETGFKLNRGGAGETNYRDFGNERIMNTSKQGKVVNGQSKELYHTTGSMVAKVHPATGGGGGAGGGSEEWSWSGAGRRNGGNGGDAGQTYSKIIIFPKQVCDFGIHGLSIPKGGNYNKKGEGGAGGTATEYSGQNGEGGENPELSVFHIVGPQSNQSVNLCTFKAGGIGGGEGGEGGQTFSMSNGSSGDDGLDISPLTSPEGPKLGDFSAYNPNAGQDRVFRGGVKGLRDGKEDGKPGTDGKDASGEILIHLLGSRGLHRN
jgi:hypothetical protein